MGLLLFTFLLVQRGGHQIRRTIPPGFQSMARPQHEAPRLLSQVAGFIVVQRQQESRFGKQPFDRDAIHWSNYPLGGLFILILTLFPQKMKISAMRSTYEPRSVDRRRSREASWSAAALRRFGLEVVGWWKGNGRTGGLVCRGKSAAAAGALQNLRNPQRASRKGEFLSLNSPGKGS